MIEDCKDILECESKLSSITTEEVSLLGEFPLSTEEVEKIGTFIKEQISENIQQGTEFLRTKAPTCLACFLVWKGILGYKDGDYWSGIRESTGLSDPNWQTRWGEIFINFLKTNELAYCDIQDALHYVTPILIHGMIPNSCLDEYFEKILIPMVAHELADSTEHKEISFLLRNRREDNKERKAIEEKIKKLQSKNKQISIKLIRHRSLIKIWDDLDEIKSLERKAGNPDELASLPEYPLEYKNKKNIAIQNLKKEVKELENEGRQYEQQRKKFSGIDKEVLTNSEAINQCVNILPKLEQELGELTKIKTQENLLKKNMKECAQSIFSELWDERYIPFIRKLPFDDLKDKIEAFNSRRISESGARRGYFENILRVIKEWVNYFFSRIIKREKTAQEIQFEISEMLKDLPIDKRGIECPKTELVHNLKQLCNYHETICHLRETRSSIEKETGKQISRIKNLAGVVDADVTANMKSIITSMQNKLSDAQRNEQSANQAEQRIKEIENNIIGLIAKKDSLDEELQEINIRLAKFGDGNIRLGLERLEQRRDAQHKAESLRNDLIRKYPNLKSLEQEKDKAQKDSKDKSYYHLEINGLDLEIEQIKQRITELKERLKQIPVPFPYVDEPIRRFLLYGVDKAKDFLIQSVKMVNQATEEQKVPSLDKIRLPERVVTRFGEWWREHKKNKEKIKDYRSPVQKSQEIFRTPMIYLDTTIGEIKVHLPSQHLSDEIIGLCLIINEDKPDSYKEQLRIYRYNENIFKTEEFDFILPFRSASYKFTLKNGSQVIRSWNIQGISPDRPFMAFNHDSKKLIKETELPKGRIWVVLHNRFVLEPQIIIEEASLYGKWRKYKYLELDLSYLGQLDLVDEQGEKKSIPISQERIFEPVLYGDPLRGCHLEEENIYIGEPPAIRIPIESDAEIERWIVSILKDSNNILAESRHYRLSDLKEISQIDKEKGIFEITLSNEKCIGKNVVGRFTVRLKNDGRHIDKWFSFCVVPYLKVEFDKDIYLPYEAGPSQVYLRLDMFEQTEIEPRNPARIIDHKDNSYEIETNALEDAIKGILRYLFKDYLISMPITVEIPRLTWRFDGLPNNEYSSESNRIEEIWFGDWKNADESLSLIVSMPSFINGQGQLSLRNLERRMEAKITEGKARFDLLGFSDTLRAGVEPLQTFELTVANSEISIANVELFKIRTRWEVEDIECVQKFYNGMLILNISWKKEKGKPEGQRIVRLWRIWEPDLDPITKQVPGGAYKVTIKKSSVELPVGRYLVHLDVEDPWSGKKVSFPSIMTLNTIEIQINPYTEIPQSILITSVLDENGQIYKLDKYEYIIYIVGKIISRELPAAVDNNGVLVKEINEGWYVGEISVKTRARVETAMDWINPVKFEYDSQNNCIETIEDKDGDGVYLCPLCKELFWNNKHYEKEKGKGHEKDLLMGNIKFKIKNKP